MLNKDRFAGHKLSTDDVLAVAQNNRVKVEIAVSRDGLMPIKLAGRWMGYVDQRLDFVSWPRVVETATEADFIAALHRRADRSKSHSICYFIGGASGAVKIGHSVDPASRLSAIRSCSPVPLDILAKAPGGPDREAAYHMQFAQFRLHGEWFERCPEIEAEITRLTTNTSEVSDDRRGCGV